MLDVEVWTCSFVSSTYGFLAPGTICDLQLFLIAQELFELVPIEVRKATYSMPGRS